MQPVSAYIHIPFCMHRCGYCDFNTYAGLQELIPAYAEALCREMEILSNLAGERISIHTVYFGGGTPSLLPAEAVGDIISGIGKYFLLRSDPEITLEANPGTVNDIYLKELHSAGVNRLSLGMQSASADDLHKLERIHSFMDVVNAMEWARAAGFNNINLDLIYGLPDQSISVWLRSLEAALILQPEHLSLYALTLETGTLLQHKINTGELRTPDPDLAADMYEAAWKRLAQEGFTQYEISNWKSEKGDGINFECGHNLQYWRNLPYLGMGAGAHGFINCHRTINVSSPSAYIKRLRGNLDSNCREYAFPDTPATVQSQPIDLITEIGETMMMGLRLVLEGISKQAFLDRFGLELEAQFSTKIRQLSALGLLEWAGEARDVLRLTHRGKLLGNRVFAEFI